MWMFVTWPPVTEDFKSSIFPEETDTCLDGRLLAGRPWAEPGPQDVFLPSIHVPWEKNLAVSYSLVLQGLFAIQPWIK